MQHLRRHVVGRADDGAHFALALGEVSGEAEVDDFGFALFGGALKEEVFGFEVAVDDAELVEVADAVEYFLHDACAHGLGDAAFADDVFEELAARAQLHDDVQVALVVEGLVELDDVGMVDLSQSADLIDEQLHVDVDRVLVDGLHRELLARVVDEVCRPHRAEVPAPDHLAEPVVLLDVVL